MNYNYYYKACNVISRQNIHTRFILCKIKVNICTYISEFNENVDIEFACRLITLGCHTYLLTFVNKVLFEIYN